ncbi:hypothetical protein K402DRAFT_197847 [Aulographum hederae CBS 113979]|uniref:Uncharacterized protein n=1 Tax=Aulographum hederae CBS 113979 TaxID=1176131 RepID=A0A6G1GNH7_9PEZI|nr:hypothetical protein K402DRAFT_197847 [Aulographum hederae CBS 113979]
MRYTSTPARGCESTRNNQTRRTSSVRFIKYSTRISRARQTDRAPRTSRNTSSTPLNRNASLGRLEWSGNFPANPTTPFPYPTFSHHAPAIPPCFEVPQQRALRMPLHAPIASHYFPFLRY